MDRRAKTGPPATWVEQVMTAWATPRLAKIAIARPSPTVARSSIFFDREFLGPIDREVEYRPGLEGELFASG